MARAGEAGGVGPLGPREEETAARVELLVALAGKPSGVGLARWRAFLARLRPVTRRVVVLHGLRGLPFHLVADLVGGITRSRADQIWRNALPKLREFLEGEGLLDD